MQYLEKSRGEATATNLAPVTLFKPRQVLLNSYSNMNQLSDQSRLILLQSLCHFLERNGFPKTLKKFFKEAHIEKESWKKSVPNLEEMCFQHLKKWNDAKVSDSAGKEQATNTKDKVIDGKKSQTKVENPPIDGFNDVKAKKKKKSKSETNKDEDVLLSVSNEHEKKSKDKKKHKDEPHEKKEEMSDLSEVETVEKADDVSQKDKKEKSKSKKKKEAIAVENTNDDVGKKLSKKRKKPSSEEDGTGGIEKEIFDDSKRRKKDNVDQSNGTSPSKTPVGSVNGVLENDKKESQSKDKTKLSNGSSEPRSAANAFRRVKEEEVEFVDERLQDNSYWAKDGADSGYGAKAQEVLGQVRGKGFRHEKTKKKRGSYRGGQIDLESHSIKFNYDEDE
ncbi:unnamed protein product [Amaranthus hypochondriacus]